jgi:hypothetical protein
MDAAFTVIKEQLGDASFLAPDTPAAAGADAAGAAVPAAKKAPAVSTKPKLNPDGSYVPIRPISFLAPS